MALTTITPNTPYKKYTHGDYGDPSYPGYAVYTNTENSFNEVQYTIGGKMITYTHRSGFDKALDKDDVKKDLTEKLVEEILRRGLIETTYTMDPATKERTFYARMYLAPDNEIKILRTHQNV